MRNRLLIAFVSLTILTLVLFGVPRAFIVAEQVREAEQRDLDRITISLGHLADALVQRQAPADTSELEALLGPADGAQVAGPGLDGPMILGEGLAQEGGIDAVRQTSNGLLVETTRHDGAVRRRVLESLTSLALVAGGVLIASAVVALVLAERLARPFRQLAAAANRLGNEEAHAVLPDTRVREAKAIRDALERSALRLSEQLRREREFAGNASHQLRTPLTGVRVRLEDLTYWPEVTDEVRAELELALTDVDRLSSTISGLLQLGRQGRYGIEEEVDAAEAVREAVQRWNDEAARRGRTLELAELEPVRVSSPGGAIAQVLDVLVQNALDHGTGQIRLATETGEGHVRLRVEDAGPGIAPENVELIFRRHHRREGSPGQGIGLPLAHDVALSMGGRLLATTSAPTAFDLVLPLASGGDPVDPSAAADDPGRDEDIEGRDSGRR